MSQTFWGDIWIKRDKPNNILTAWLGIALLDFLQIRAGLSALIGNFDNCTCTGSIAPTAAF
jgi:hypothetical protein